MSDKEKQILQKLIPSIEQNVEKLESLEQDNENAKEQIQELKQKLEYLKDIAWDRQSKKESSQMFNVLEGRKESTEVKSNIGSVKVGRDYMQKEVDKHLDNPKLRGMITKPEMLSFPKVAKNVEPEYEERYQGYAWKVKANDENILNYGERDYGQGHTLLTTHSKTGRDERGQLRREFNDRNFHNPADESITQNEQTKANDENILAYGSRKYEFNNEEVHRLATNHSKTSANERMAEEDRRGHPYHPVFNDLNFRKSTNEGIIAQNKPNSANSLNKEQNTNKNIQKAFTQEQIKSIREQARKLL